MERERIGSKGSSVDELVWAVICYLDSPTDYRELLPRTDQRVSQQSQLRKVERRKNENQISPRSCAPPAQKNPQNGDLVLLDNIPKPLWPKLGVVTLIGILLYMLLLGSLRN